MNIKAFVVLLLSISIICGVCSCGSAPKEDPSSAPETEEEMQPEESESSEEVTVEQEEAPEDLTVEINKSVIDKLASDDKSGILNPDYSAKTDVVFSEGEAESWSYSHNKREFPIEECYLKVSTTAITKHFWGNDDEIEVFFVFTGIDNCDVESTKGVVDSAKSKDSNIKIFKKTLYAAKPKKAETIVSEFKIIPKQACGLRIDVIYDSRVPRKNDDSSTIYFTKKAKKQSDSEEE